MAKITRPETIIEVGLSGWHTRKVVLTFSTGMVKQSDGKFSVEMSKTTTTKLINALRSQRKRKRVK